jgi:hypothetical protein
MAYVHFFDSTSPTFGTTDPLFTIGVPGGSATSPGIYREVFPVPISFASAIKVVADVNDDDTSTTGPATGLSGVVYYK